MMAMDSSTIAVLVMTAAAAGVLVWLSIHSRRTGGASDESQERPATERPDATPPAPAPQHQTRKKKP